MKKDLTVGSPLKLILAFGLPLLLSNLFQQCYNLADTAIVGNTLGDEALSAIGSVSVIFGLLTSLCFGMSNGFSILVAKFFGAGDEKRMKKAVAWTILLGIIVNVVLTTTFTLLLKPFMRLLNTPEEIFDNAYSYIIVIVTCCIVMMFYNMLASTLRALGNSKIPLVFLIISSALNIGMDLFFIQGLRLGLPGAAWATVIAQLISGVCCLIYIIKKCPELKLTRDDFRFDGQMIKDLLASGAAMALMFAVVNVGTVILQSGINGLGTETIAAHVAARKISELLMLGGSALASTVSTFASQNYGAGKWDRIWQGVKVTHLLGFAWSAIVIITIFFGAEAIIGGVSGSDNPFVIATGARYLRIDTLFYFILMVLCFMRSTLQGLGSKVWPIVGSVIELLGKFIFVKFFVKPFGYEAIIWCEPVLWCICGVMISIVFFTKKEIRAVVFKKKSA